MLIIFGVHLREKMCR